RPAPPPAPRPDPETLRVTRTPVPTRPAPDAAGAAPAAVEPAPILDSSCSASRCLPGLRAHSPTAKRAYRTEKRRKNALSHSRARMAGARAGKQHTGGASVTEGNTAGWGLFTGGAVDAFAEEVGERKGMPSAGSLFAGGAVDAFAEEVGVAQVAGVLLDHVQV